MNDQKHQKLSPRALALLDRLGLTDAVAKVRSMPFLPPDFSFRRFEVHANGVPMLVWDQVPLIDLYLEETPDLIEVFLDHEPAFMQTAEGEIVYSRLCYLAAREARDTEQISWFVEQHPGVGRPTGRGIFPVLAEWSTGPRLNSAVQGQDGK